MIIQLPVAEPNPGIYPDKRRCDSCRCFLSRNNPDDLCYPCQGEGVVIELRPDQVA